MAADARGAPRRLNVVGTAALVPIGTVRAAAEHAQDGRELLVERVHNAYASARRFPAPTATAARATDELAWLDRVDAVRALFGHTEARRSRRYVTSACTLLGGVLRDPAWVARQIARIDQAARRAGDSDRQRGTPDIEARVRRALVCALGLLGAWTTSSSMALGLPASPTTPDVEAYLAALIAAELDGSRVEARLAAVRRDEPPTLGVVAARVRAALADGRLLSALETPPRRGRPNPRPHTRTAP